MSTVDSYSYLVDWTFDYPPNCTPEDLAVILEEKAALWQGWSDFPWYLTRTLHRQIDEPVPDWDHLHTLVWVTGYACHTVLYEPFENRQALFRLLISKEVQFLGIFRHMVLEGLRWCLLFKEQSRVPDCAPANPRSCRKQEAIENRRAEFQKRVEFAVSEFVRVLNFASEVPVLDGWIAGHPLDAWFEGAHVPNAGRVATRLEEKGNRLFMRPCENASARFVGKNQPVPRIEVCPVCKEPIGPERPEAAESVEIEEPPPEVMVINEYRQIRVGDDVIDLARKYKRRRFVRFVHERRLETGQDTFYFGEMKDLYAETTGRTIESERFEQDLFKGQSREFALLFEVVDRDSDLFRIKI